MIRVLIGDDHPIVRAGIRRIIESEPDMSVAGEAVDADELLALAQAVPADIATVDISMAGPEFTEVLGRLNAMTPSVRTIVLSVFPEEQFAPRALRAGARGYLSKDQSPEQLVTALRRVYSGHRYVSPRLAEWLASRLEHEPSATPADALSAREYQVLRLIGSGLTVKQTGERLSLSPKTVSTYRGRILEKLGLRSTSDVVRFAVEHRLTGD